VVIYSENGYLIIVKVMLKSSISPGSSVTTFNITNDGVSAEAYTIIQYGTTGESSFILTLYGTQDLQNESCFFSNVSGYSSGTNNIPYKLPPGTTKLTMTVCQDIITISAGSTVIANTTEELFYTLGDVGISGTNIHLDGLTSSYYQCGGSQLNTAASGCSACSGSSSSAKSKMSVGQILDITMLIIFILLVLVSAGIITGVVIKSRKR
jgi:hypothetical protein